MTRNKVMVLAFCFMILAAMTGSFVYWLHPPGKALEHAVSVENSEETKKAQITKQEEEQLVQFLSTMPYMEQRKELEKRRLTRVMENTFHHWPEKVPINTVEDALKIIPDRSVFPLDRSEAFKWLKDHAPDEYEKLTEKYAGILSGDKNEINRMRMNDLDSVIQEAGDVEFSLYMKSARYILSKILDNMEKSSPREKVVKIIRTMHDKKWPVVMGVTDYCQELQGEMVDIAAELGSPIEIGRLVFDCREFCDVDCLKGIWNIGKNDWSKDGVQLKETLVVLASLKQKYPFFNEIFAKLKEIDQLDSVARGYLMRIVLAHSDKHCIPYDEMLKIADDVPDPEFKKGLMKQEREYRRKYDMFCEGRGKRKTNLGKDQ